jgi:hypothetical protein
MTHLGGGFVGEIVHEGHRVSAKISHTHTHTQLEFTRTNHGNGKLDFACEIQLQCWISQAKTNPRKLDFACEIQIQPTDTVSRSLYWALLKTLLQPRAHQQLLRITGTLQTPATDQANVHATATLATAGLCHICSGVRTRSLVSLVWLGHGRWCARALGTGAVCLQARAKDNSSSDGRHQINRSAFLPGA